MEMTPSLENYLETIYVLSKGGAPVRVTDVALNLNVSKASVNRAMSHLKTAELISQEHYGTLTLTSEGIQYAKEVLRRHQLLTAFLIRVLNIDPDTAEADACKMEHVVSVETMKKLTQYMEKLEDVSLDLPDIQEDAH